MAVVSAFEHFCPVDTVLLFTVFTVLCALINKIFIHSRMRSLLNTLTRPWCFGNGLLVKAKIIMSFRAYHHSPVHNLVQRNTKLEGKYSLESTDPRESEIRAHLRP